ncbi:MAG TPA: hypothetical protein VFO62_10450 [Candidatus Binatia bacterium]|nr:hypothetical protein [Candidatus Binatia bacterium]
MMAYEVRYFIDHGAIHDRITGQHVDEEQAVTLLNGAPSPVPPIDYTALDPGIRETVRRLRAAGFATTDSGDGVSKLEAGTDIGEALSFPHAVIRCEPDRLVAEARRLHAFLGEHGFCVEPVGVSSIWIQADYDPTNDVATIMLAGVADAAWRAGAVSPP